MNNTAILNVCILPTSSVAEQCIAISKSFEQDLVRFQLGDKLFPHMTVYMARFEEDKIDELKSRLTKVVSSLKPVHMQHSGYFLTGGDYLEVSYRKTDAVLQFHDQIIQALKDLRANPGEVNEESYYAPFTAEQKQNVQETGYDLAYSLYRPHVTLTRYKESQLPDKFPALPVANLSFTIPKIALYKADENGAIYEEIITLELA